MHVVGAIVALLLLLLLPLLVTAVPAAAAAVTAVNGVITTAAFRSLGTAHQCNLIIESFSSSPSVLQLFVICVDSSRILEYIHPNCWMDGIYCSVQLHFI